MNARTRSTRRRGGLFRTAGWFAAAGLLAVSAFAPGAAMAASVTPTPISDVANPTCDDFGDWIEVKADPPGNKTVGDGTLSVTITNFVQSSSGTPGSFDWSSNIGIDAVLVKAGSSKHNLYVYDPESTGDTNLQPQAGTGNGISHISFCYDADQPTPTPPTPTPPTPTPPTPTPPTPTPPTPTPPTPTPPTPTPPTPTPPTPTPTGSELPVESENPTPTGQVGGVVGTPRVTPPSTDAIGDAAPATAGSWRIVLAGLAGLIAALLLFTQPRKATRRAR